MYFSYIEISIIYPLMSAQFTMQRSTTKFLDFSAQIFFVTVSLQAIK
jgi:hypothetical protein